MACSCVPARSRCAARPAAAAAGTVRSGNPPGSGGTAGRADCGRRSGTDSGFAAAAAADLAGSDGTAARAGSGFLAAGTAAAGTVRFGRPAGSGGTAGCADSAAAAAGLRSGRWSRRRS